MLYAFDTAKGETPETIKRRRAVVDAMMSRMAAPQTIGEGINAVGQGLVAGVLNARANKAETAGRTASAERWGKLFSGGTGGGSTGYGEGNVPTESTSATANGSTIPQTADAQKLRQGMIDRGLPEHVADGFLMNFQDESGLNPGINEKAPLVAGSRGGYGLYQLTGPRRVAYEKFAADRGVSPDSTDAQLDFLMTELQGPEARAAQSIFSAKDAGSAATAIARDFLRPAKEHLDARIARYRGTGTSPVAAAMEQAAPVQVASLDPNAGFENVTPNQPGQQIGGGERGASVVDAMLSKTPMGGEMQRMGVPSAPAPAQVAQADPVGGSVMADASQGQFPPAPSLPAQGGGYGDNISTEQLLEAASDPWLNDAQRSVVGALLEQRLAQQQPKRSIQTIYGQDGNEQKVWFDERTGQYTPLGGAKTNLLTPEELAQKKDIAAAGKTSVTVMPNGEPGDGELRKALDKGEGDLWAEYKKQGSVSGAMGQDFQILDELIKMAPQGPVQGRLAETFAGVSSAGDAFQSIVKRIAPTLRAPGSGSTSDIEYDGMLRSLPALRNQPEANAMIAEIMKAKAQLNMQRADIITQYQTGEKTAAQARREIAELDKQSIMSPEMKKALDGIGGEKQGEVPTPASQEEFDALPSGSIYIDPDDGKRYRKP